LMNWKASLTATAVGAVSGTAVGLLAFFFLTSRQFPSMGATLFLLAPVAAGFSVAMVSRRPDITSAAALLSVACSLVLLIALGKEGVLCAILAFPIIAAGLAIGIGMGLLMRRLFVNRAKNQTTTTGILLLIAPTLVLAGEHIERPMLRRPRTELIETAVQVDDSPERVWAQVLAIDSVQASKPLLMYVGLPIPERCSIDEKGVGARRTCYFNVGYIEETVIAWNPPYYLGLSIDRTHMPGRHWLAFESADYRLEPDGSGARLTRRTTVLSYLHPSWYWRLFERLGVESEHDYILRDIVLKAKR